MDRGLENFQGLKKNSEVEKFLSERTCSEKKS
jgi:hypothetical protein